MEYPRPYILKPGDQIVIDDLTTFFVTYMKNDTMANKERGADGLLSAIYTKHADKIDVGDLTTFFVTHEYRHPDWSEREHSVLCGFWTLEIILRSDSQAIKGQSSCLNTSLNGYQLEWIHGEVWSLRYVEKL